VEPRGRAIILSRLTDWERPNWLNGEFSVRSRRVSLERPPPLKVARQRRRQKGHPVVATNRQQLHLVSRRWSRVGPSTAALCRCWMALYLARGQRSALCIMLSFFMVIAPTPHLNPVWCRLSLPHMRHRDLKLFQNNFLLQFKFQHTLIYFNNPKTILNPKQLI
jgi:hypothetical protein